MLSRRWAVLLPCLLLLGACQSESKNSTPDGKERPAFVLSEPVPLPGNHNRIPLTVDPRRRPTTNANPSQNPSQNPNANPNTGPDAAADSGSNQPNGGGSTANSNDKPKTVFDPENLRVKPGHWIAVQSEGESTQEDFTGQLQYSMRKGDLTPRLIPGTRYFQRSQRPANLAKEQKKRFEIPLFVVDSAPLNVLPELQTRHGGLVAYQPESFTPLQDHQYHCVVLSDRPDSYNYLSVLPSIRNIKLNQWLGDAEDVAFTEDGELVQDFSNPNSTFHIESLYYKLTLSRWASEVELPANVQQWTSIAYLLWSDFDPDRLSPEQQTALVDWLHFGGQLIVSGDGLDGLSASFLKDYLPVRPRGSKNEPTESLLPILEQWSLQKGPRGQVVLPTIAPSETFVRSLWELDPNASEVLHSNGLLAERQVGKGRIVTAAFPLNMTPLRAWTSYDHWFNSCLLRRPGRTHRSEEEFIDQPRTWQFQGLGQIQPTEPLPPLANTGFTWVTKDLEPHLPSVFTTLNFASRDWRHAEASPPAEAGNGAPSPTQEYLPIVNPESRRFAMGATERSQGQWDDYSEISNAARVCLKEQAGITPPSREWVLRALLIYLAVLVPLNYVVFRLVRRLELAWFSIPFIAIAGAVIVVRAASLDIGFSNKNLQVNVIEVPTNYSRGHLTGYGSLYSSLTSQFRFESDNPTTVALPFPAANQLTEVSETPAEFTMEPGRPVRFGPQQILSNTMEMYQFQQMVDLNGSFRFQPAEQNPGASADQVENQTKLNLSDVGLFKLDDQGHSAMFCRLDELPAGGTASIQWRVLQHTHELPHAWNGTCLEDRVHLASEVVALFAAQDREPYSTEWPEAITVLRESKPELADALQRVALRRNLAPTMTLTPALLDSALQDIAPPGLSLGSLFRAATRYPLGPGEVRLVGWTAEAVDQWQVFPIASQSAQRSLVIAHLAQPVLPALSFDTNLAYPPTRSSNSDSRPATPPNTGTTGTSPDTPPPAKPIENQTPPDSSEDQTPAKPNESQTSPAPPPENQPADDPTPFHAQNRNALADNSIQNPNSLSP